METLIITIVIILIGSGFFSATEAALFSTTLNKAKMLAAQNKKGAQQLLIVKKNIRPTITVLVVFTNIFNIAGSMLVGVMASSIFASTKIGFFSAIFTFLIIVFAEIVPKSIGEAFANSISVSLARPLLFLTKAMKPFTLLIDIITKPIPSKKKTVSEEEIRSLSNIGFLEGVIEEDEKDMIHRVFLLNDLRVEDIMTPRTVVTAFEDDKKIKDIEKDLFCLTHSRIPIYKENLDNIIGVCHQRELLIALAKGHENKLLLDFANREVTTFHKNQKIDELIPVFRRNRCHLAIVVDDFGGTAGVISLEDVLEQIIGSVIDETDKTPNLREEARKKRKAKRS